MSFWDHLDEFRSRLLVILATIFIGSLIGYSLSESFIQFLILPSQSLDISFQVITVTSMFMIKLFVCFFIGLLIAFPVLIYNLIQFILPALQVQLRGIFLLVILSSFFFLFRNIFCLFYNYSIFANFFNFYNI